MEKSLSILLIEDEPAEYEAFVQYIESIEEARLVQFTNNADKALEYAKDYLPDVIILDLELHKGSGNGLSFLMELGKEQLPFSPYILVTTNNISPVTHAQARKLGADFVMVKSQIDYSAENVVEFLLALKGIIHDSRKKSSDDKSDAESPAEAKRRLSAQVAAEIDLVRISPKVLGRNYLVDAIILIHEGQRHNYISSIAQKYGKTDASVERAMQTAINRAWRTSNIEDLERYYTAFVNPEKGVPTLNEFVFHYVNKIKVK